MIFFSGPDQCSGASRNTSMRLDFSKLEVFGRERQLRQLEDAYQTATKKSKKKQPQPQPAAAADAGQHQATATANTTNTSILKGKPSKAKAVVALVSGYSGTGKSTLVKKGLAEPCASDGGFFCSGKFEQYGSLTKPYSAVVDAFTDLCDQLVAVDAAYYYEMLEEALGQEDYYLLSVVVPAFGDLKRRPITAPVVSSAKATAGASAEFSTATRTRYATKQPRRPSPTSTTSTTSSFAKGVVAVEATSAASAIPEAPQPTTTMKREWGFERLKKVLRKVLAALCTPEKPVLIFLDDLQWCNDTGCLDLFTDMATEFDGHGGFVLVGAYRDNEVFDSTVGSNDRHPLRTRVLDKLDADLVTGVHVANLDLLSIQQLISAVADLPVEETAPLARAVQAKTGGNAFFAIQFLKLLREEGLLYYSVSDGYRWQWDFDAILGETTVSENVVDVVAGRIHRLPDKEQTVLTIGSCMGCRIDVDSLVYILGHETSTFDAVFPTPPSREDVVALLDKAVFEGLVNPCSSPLKYKFSHDRIQQGAYAQVIEGKEREGMHLTIGRIMLELNESATGEPWMLMVAIDQLDRGSLLIDDPTDRVELVKLNLEAAVLVAERSAFFPAADYLDKGTEFLGKDYMERSYMWMEQYELCLELYSFSAEMEYCCGRFDRAQEKAEFVLAHAKSLEAKTRIYFTLIEIFGVQKQYQEAMSIGHRLLRELGEPWPKKARAHHVIWEMMRVKRKVKSMKDEDIWALPVLEDERRTYVLKTLAAIVTFNWWADEREEFALVCLRMAWITLTEGHCSVSGVSMMFMSFMAAAAWKDFDNAERLAHLSMELNHRFHGEQYEARFPGVLNGAVLSLRSPLTGNLDPFLHAYHVGLKSGDLDYGIIASGCYLITYYYAGLPLPVFAEDAKMYIAQMVEYKQSTFLLLASVHYQCALNLMGRAKNPAKLRGEALDVKALPPGELDNNRSAQAVYLATLQLAYYFDDMKTALRMAEALLPYKERDFPVIWSFPPLFFRTLVWYEFARTTGKRRYKKLARREMKTISRWVNWGFTNVHHMYLILLAEKAVLDGESQDKIKSSYDAAIRAAGRSGFKQNQALANERLGKYFYEQKNDEWAEFYLDRAHLLYKAWGAKAKANHLEAKYTDFVQDAKTVVSFSTGGAIHGRKRFSSKPSELHKTRDFVALSSDTSSTLLSPVMT